MQSEPRATYLHPTQEAGRAFVLRRISGEVIMLNLLRFREVADYSADPQLAPTEPISGAEAFQRYIEHTLPHLRRSGGDLIFFGRGGQFLIGPPDERWDAAMLGVSPSNRCDSHYAGCCALMVRVGIGLGDGRVKPPRVPKREAPVRPPVSSRRADTT